MSKAQEFLLEAAAYFENRPTNGEDKAHWSNVYNAKNCRDIARKYGAMLEAIEKLLACPAIADGNHSEPAWGCEETAEAEALARAALSKATGGE